MEHNSGYQYNFNESKLIPRLPPKTLYEMAAEAENELHREVYYNLARSCDLFLALPFANIGGGAYYYDVEAAQEELPSVNFRGFNEVYPVSTMRGCKILNSAVECLKIAGGDLDVDIALVATRGMGIRASQEAMKLKALALCVADKFINGNSMTEPREFDGLRQRLAADARLRFNMKETLDVQVGNLVRMVPGCTHLIMAKTQLRHLNKLAKAGIGELKIVGEQGERSASFCTDVYKPGQEETPVVERETQPASIPILRLDYNDKGSRIIENGDIFAVRFGPDHICGLQNAKPAVYDFGHIAAAPVFRKRVEWLMGVAVMNGGAAAMLTQTT